MYRHGSNQNVFLVFRWISLVLRFFVLCNIWHEYNLNFLLKYKCLPKFFNHIIYYCKYAYLNMPFPKHAIFPTFYMTR